MRIAVHRGTIAPGSRLAHALIGLAARGHRVTAPGSGAAAAAREQADVAVGGTRALGPAWLMATSGARALVLALQSDMHKRWGFVDRWAWSFSGAWGLVEEREVNAFLAQAAPEDRERVAIWPTSPAPGEPSLHADTELLERLCERALARRSAGPGRGALFVDRDGTVIAERHHLSEPDDVTLLPGVAEALRSARAAAHPVVVISNQAGVGRGLFPESRVYEVMARLRALLRAEGVELDAVRYCPHAPEEHCDCRKPGTRLLREAAEDLRLSLPDSVMIGDKWIDVEAGRAARAAGVLVRTGHGAEELALERPLGSAAADKVCDDLPGAVRWYLGRER